MPDEVEVSHLDRDLEGQRIHRDREDDVHALSRAWAGSGARCLPGDVGGLVVLEQVVTPVRVRQHVGVHQGQDVIDVAVVADGGRPLVFNPALPHPSLPGPIVRRQRGVRPKEHGDAFHVFEPEPRVDVVRKRRAHGEFGMPQDIDPDRRARRPDGLRAGRSCARGLWHGRFRRHDVFWIVVLCGLLRHASQRHGCFRSMRMTSMTRSPERRDVDRQTTGLGAGASGPVMI